jgi:uncharacterized protein YqhQ
MSYFLLFCILFFLIFPLFLASLIHQQYQDDFYESDGESLALLEHLVRVNSEWLDKRS